MSEKRRKIEPLLTIAIPHLNDPEGLLRTLESVYQYSSADIEVIICENRSDEIFETRLQQIRNRFVGLEFIKSSIKLNYDSNVDRCVRNSNGEFAWLIGCGDCPRGNSVRDIMQLLNDNRDASSFLVFVETSMEDMRAEEESTNGRRQIKTSVL